MTAITVRLSEKTAEKLEKLARKTERSGSNMAAEAIEEFVSRQEWQLAEIEAGLNEAEAGDFAGADELSDVVAKYVKSNPIR